MATKRDREEESSRGAADDQTTDRTSNDAKRPRTGEEADKKDDDVVVGDLPALEYLSNGAIKTTGTRCEGGCSFHGGNSGYCSVCWKKLSEEAKKEANEKAAREEPLRSQKLALEQAEKKEREEREAREQEAKEKAEREVFEKERQELKDAGKSYPLVRSTPNYPRDDSIEDAKEFGGRFSELSDLELWSTGIYNSSVALPNAESENAVAESVRLTARWTELKSKLEPLGDKVTIHSEGDSSFYPFFIPVAGIPELESCTLTRDVLNKVFNVNDKVSMVEGSDMRFTEEPEVFDGYVNSKGNLKKLIAGMKEMGERGSFIIYEPFNTDSCYAPAIMAARDPANGKDVFIVAAMISWT